MALKDDAFGLVRTSFMIVALYLVLRYAAGARGIIGAATNGWVNLVKALQGPR